jgi:hypothetical protein
MKAVFTLIFSLTSTGCMLLAQHNVNINTVDTNLHLYILMGQSNMAGRGEITAEFKSVNHPAVFMLNKRNEWVTARHPVHFDKAVAGVGPGLSFAIAMANQNPGVKIGLIPCAVGGTSINSWQPGGYDSATNTHPYDDAVVRINMAMQTGVIKGMLWHQGESDSKPSSATAYPAKLKTLIERIRDITNNQQMPVIAGELGRYREPYQTINLELTKIPSTISNTAVASSEGLTDKGDNTHFDSPSAKKLGERYAEKMILLKKNTPNENKKRKNKKNRRS